MIKEAIMHTPLSKDAFALDEKNLVVRLRTAKDDMKQCAVFYGDRVCIVEPIHVTECIMEKIATDQLFDYYEAKIESLYSRVCYYFKCIGKDGEAIYVSEYGLTKDMKCHRTQYFQFPYLHRNDLIKVPKWTNDMVMYHIFPDSFASGRRELSSKKNQITLENGLTSKAHNGGTIRGVIDNLDYLESLHVNCIYFNPLFMAASYHKYDTIDYFEVDPCFGTKDDLRELVEKSHQKGIYVIFDGVFNHCGEGFFAFRDVLKNQEKSQYKDWFYQLKFPIDTSVPPNYEAFAYVPEMPKLDTSNPKVREYFCEVGKYWIREVGIDGWRLDVANEINHEFWRAFKRAVKEEKEDAFLIGEIWENSAIWLMGDQFDSTMNYSFSYICREFFAEGKIDAEEFAQKICQMNLRYPSQVSQMQMNFLDTHDVPRFLSYCDGDIEKLKLAVFFMMTAQGIPSVFYGDEKGIMGVTESEYRSPMPWSLETDLEEYYASVIQMRRNYKALQMGDFRVVAVLKQENTVVFERIYKDECIYVVINNSEEEVQFETKAGKLVCPAMSGMIKLI